MRKPFLILVLLALLCTPALAAGASPAAQAAPGIAAQIQAMRINEVVRMKVEKESDFAGSGLKGLKQGDEVELQKVAADKLKVKHMPTGQTGELSQPEKQDCAK